MKKTLLILFYFGFSSFILGQESIKINNLQKELQQELVDSCRVSIKLKIANLYLKNRIDSSLFYYNMALELANKINSEGQQAEILYRIAISFENKNEYKKAIENYIKSLSIFEKLNNDERIASINNFIGACYLHLYAEDKAIEYYSKSLAVYKKINDDFGIAYNYIDLGNLYYEQENYEYAKKYFYDALKIYESLNDQLGIATSYTNIGNATADDEGSGRGLKYYFQSIDILTEIKDEYGVAANYNNIGDCYIEMENYPKALDYFRKALEIAEKLESKELISIVLLNVSDAQNKLKRYSSSIVNAKKSLAIARKYGIIEYEVANLEHLLIAYEGLGETNQAIKYHKLYKKIKDSLQIIDKAKKVQLFNTLTELEKTQYTISDLSAKNELAQIKYKNEKQISFLLIIAMVVFAFLIILLIHQQTSKKKAYNLLAYKNFQINRMNNEIEVQLDNMKRLNGTKDKFFSIIAHDLKNPFNSIKGFTELMIENSSDYDEEKRLKFLKIIKGATTKASNLLDNLLIWANAQIGNIKFEPKKIELKKQVSSVVSLLEIQAINKDIKIINEVENDIFVEADANMLCTILRNLISNAIKFTKPRGSVKISSSSQNNFIEIKVKDNGVGISEASIKNLFNIEAKNSNLGTANEQGTGLGLILCKDFVEKNGGKLQVQSTINKGSEFKFTLPKYKIQLNLAN